MSLIRRLSLYLAVPLLFGCSESSAPRPGPAPSLDAAAVQVGTAGNDFSFALFQQIAKREAGKNVFVSPLSASMSLGMVLNGAAGSTLDAMRSALRLGAGDVTTLDGGYRELIDGLRGLDPTTTFQIANSIWYRNTFQFKQPFLDTTKKYFDARIQGLDFTDQKGSLAAINGWVSQATGGTIPTILDQISADEVMFLINAIYFKGTWQVQFDPKATQPGTFHAADGTLQTVQFMNRPEHLEPRFKLGSVDRIAIAELPYGNGDFAMDIVTGAFGTPVDVDSVAAALTPPTWAGLLASLRDVDFGLVLPKFTMSYERTLNDDLSALGMGVAFTEAAEFPGLSPAALMLEFVKQKTFVQVDEAGTTAGASTVTGVVPVSLSEFRVDHPFVFVIRERRTGTILFVGKVLKIPNG